MCFPKQAKPLALTAAILVLLAGLISCATQAPKGQAPTGPAPGAKAVNPWGGHFPPERLHLIGQVPPDALAWRSVETRFPAISYDFPEFLDGTWGEEYGDIFHLVNDGEDIGYSLSGWPLAYGWAGPFVAVYYIDDQNPEAGGLVFANFMDHPGWCLTPPESSGYTISAFYYERIDDDTYYLMNLAKKLPAPDPDFPGYDYGQPMYPTIAAALNELIEQGELPGMLLAWTEYKRQQ